MIDRIKKLFFEETLKRWRFDEIVKETKISRERVNHFIKKLLKDGFVIRVKERKKMPYYIANRESQKFRFEKRLYGLRIIEDSGLFEHITTLKEVKTAILFGSFERGDFGKSSDVDLFIYGDSKDFNKKEFERKLKRDIQLFSYNNPEKIKKSLDPKLIHNMINGFSIKGNLEPFEVIVGA